MSKLKVSCPAPQQKEDRDEDDEPAEGLVAEVRQEGEVGGGAAADAAAAAVVRRHDLCGGSILRCGAGGDSDFWHIIKEGGS